MIDAAPPFLRDILDTLQQTGARPGEVLTVTAKEFDAPNAVWMLREHKTARKTGGLRVVYLTPQVVATCARLAKAYPTGPLFRTVTGKAFPPTTYLPRLVKDLRVKLGLPNSVIPYGFRHTFATEALARGTPDALVAELMGHKGTTMLHRHYAHLGTKAAALREALRNVRG